MIKAKHYLRWELKKTHKLYTLKDDLGMMTVYLQK